MFDYDTVVDEFYKKLPNIEYSFICYVPDN